MFGVICDFVPFDLKFQQEIKLLFDDDFGKGFLETKNFNNPFLKVYCLVENAILIGCCALLTEEGKGVIDFIIVKKNHRNKGLGKFMVQELVSEAEKKDLRNLEINHWVKIKAPKPYYAISFGFEKTISTPQYWSKDSLSYNYICPECKQLPCNCTRDLYSLSLIKKAS